MAKFSPPESRGGGVQTPKIFILVLAASALFACGRPPSAEDLAELEQVRQESAALNESLNGLETQLIVGRSLVSADRDLRQRHEQVSEVACQNLSDHWSGISRFISNQREKQVKKSRQRVA